MQYQLRISGNHHTELMQHLFPGDGEEAVALALCGQHNTKGKTILLVHKLELIPYEECERSSLSVKWKTDRMLKLLDEASTHNYAVLKIHSHPSGYNEFSETDDTADQGLFPYVFTYCESDSIHGSAVMLPGGKIFGRIYTHDMVIHPFEKISVAGDRIQIWHKENIQVADEFSVRTIQAFGEGTYAIMKQMKIGVVGCSGTGSPTIEQLARLGIGTLVLVDPDLIEKKNLNRILNSTLQDAIDGKSKTELLSEAITKMGLGTQVLPFTTNLYDSMEALLELATCDVIIGCMDSVDGRHILNQLANFYLIPYIDMGVRLRANDSGGIDTIVGSVHYLQPGLSSLLSRHLYTPERLRAEGLKRVNPTQYEELARKKYVDNVDVERPAVISVNMSISSMAVMELLNRLHPFKDEIASYYAKVMIDFCGGCIENVSEEKFEVDEYASRWAGRGDCIPFLRTIDLQYEKAN